MTAKGLGSHALGARRLQRAQAHLKSTRDLLEHDDFADSVSRSCYAIFQAARALLAVEEFDSHKHSGVISLFNRHFVKHGIVDKELGVILKDAQRQRELADYNDLAEFSREEAESQLRDAEHFVDAITRVLEKMGHE